MLFSKKVLILKKSFDFINVFLKKSAEILLKYIKINKHIIKLKKIKQPFHSLINNLGLIKLKIFKTYIIIDLANGFIYPLKYHTNTLTLFIFKLNSSFCFCVNYQKFNNLIIKNLYLQLLIEKFYNN